MSCSQNLTETWRDKNVLICVKSNHFHSFYEIDKAMALNSTKLAYNNTIGIFTSSTEVIQNVNFNKNIYCIWFEFLVGSCFSYVMIFFGFFGNVLSIWTMWDERHTSPTSFLLIILGFMDNLVLISGGWLHGTFS